MAIEREDSRGRFARIDRARVIRTLTFWLRPEFVLRVINRFQKIVGFDRAIALASSTLTAVIPLTIVTSAIFADIGGKDTAERIIDRYELTGGGAEAVRDMFAPASGASTSLGVAGFFFFLVAVLSFTRGVQRLFETTWELKPLSVRNTLNGLLWAGGLVVYMGITGLLHALLGDRSLDLLAALAGVPFSVAFLVGSGWVLSARRIALNALVPFAVTGSLLLAAYNVGVRVYVPHLFSSYATRYGVIGAVFAMISALFCLMVIIVGSAALGREIHDELVRIREGRKPPEDAVRRQWDEITAEARARWQMVQVRLKDRRRRRSPK